jgi:putative glycosyltransferase (TIGR04372 family)
MTYFPKKILHNQKIFFYFKFLKFVRIILNFSVFIYIYLNKKKLNKYTLCVLDVNSYGDSVLYLDYLRLKILEEKKSFVLLIIPDLKMQKDLAKIFLKTGSYLVYKQIVYKALIFLINIYYKLKGKRGSFIIDINFNLNVILKEQLKKSFNYWDDITFYHPFKINKKLFFEKYKKKFNIFFLKKYLFIRTCDNKAETSFKHINLLNKYGHLNFKKKIDQNYKDSLFKELRIKKNFVCFFIRPFNDLEKNIKFKYKKEVDPRSTASIESYKTLISSYILKKGYQVILMGSFHSLFDQDFFYKNCINYRNSIHQNAYNDFIITQYCRYCITDPGGFFIVPSILNKPTLMINSSGFFDNYCIDKLIYMPKKFIQNNKIMKFLDIIKSEVFFENGVSAYRKNEIITEDINYDELLLSVKNFEEMIKFNKFTINHKNQNKIKNKLSSLHLLANLSYKKYSKVFLDSNSF